jgi:hypothetical protein
MPYWMGLQEDYDLEGDSRTAAKAIASIHPFFAKAVG